MLCSDSSIFLVLFIVQLVVFVVVVVVVVALREIPSRPGSAALPD